MTKRHNSYKELNDMTVQQKMYNVTVGCVICNGRTYDMHKIVSQI